MAGERGRLRVVGTDDPIWRLWQDLPAEWRDPVIGDGIANWKAITENGERRLKLTGLPDLIAAEMAWMAHWQAQDGTRSSVLALNQLANILRRAAANAHPPFPDSIRAMDWETASAMQGWFYATRWKRLPPKGSRDRLRVVFRFARLALIAACHDGNWWELDDWHPRCDPRIPLSDREPLANYGCQPGQIAARWLRLATTFEPVMTARAHQILQARPVELRRPPGEPPNRPSTLHRHRRQITDRADHRPALELPPSHPPARPPRPQHQRLPVLRQDVTTRRKQLHPPAPVRAQPQATNARRHPSTPTL